MVGKTMDMRWNQRLNPNFPVKAITVAQIKILYSSSGRVGDHFESVICVRGKSRGQASKQASKQAYINKIISATSSIYKKTLHNIQMRAPRLETSHELLGRVRALWPVPDRTTWGLFLSLRVCPDLTSSATEQRAIALKWDSRQRTPSCFPFRLPGHTPTSTDPPLHTVSPVST